MDSIVKRSCDNIFGKLSDMQSRIIDSENEDLKNRCLSPTSPTSDEFKTHVQDNNLIKSPLSSNKLLKFSVDRLLSDDRKKDCDDDQLQNKLCCGRSNYNQFAYNYPNTLFLNANPPVIKRPGEEFGITGSDYFSQKSILRPMPIRIERGADQSGGGLANEIRSNCVPFQPFLHVGSFPLFRLNQFYPQPKYASVAAYPYGHHSVGPTKPSTPAPFSPPTNQNHRSNNDRPRSSTGNVSTSRNSQTGNTKRKRSWSRAVFSNLQRKGLEIAFGGQKYITKPDRRKLAARLGLTDAQVKVWFQNRRMKWRHTGEDRKSAPDRQNKMASNTKSTKDASSSETMRMSSDSELDDDVDDEIDVLMD